MNEIVNIVLGEFSYRFGGLDECLAAFGNFWQIHETEIKLNHGFLSHN
jgi:hypothetical protein